MPWTPNDAERHTHKATTWELKELWAKVARRIPEANRRRRPRCPGGERRSRAAGGSQLLTEQIRKKDSNVRFFPPIQLG